MFIFQGYPVDHLPLSSRDYIRSSHSPLATTEQMPIMPWNFVDRVIKRSSKLRRSSRSRRSSSCRSAYIENTVFRWERSLRAYERIPAERVTWYRCGVEKSHFPVTSKPLRVIRQREDVDKETDIEADTETKWITRCGTYRRSLPFSIRLLPLRANIATTERDIVNCGSSVRLARRFAAA